MSFEKVKEIIVETIHCNAGEVTLYARMKEDLGADSLDAVELNMALEEEYGIIIDEDALAGFLTVKDIVDYIDGQTAS